jgi:hypothetical protein
MVTRCFFLRAFVFVAAPPMCLIGFIDFISGIVAAGGTRRGIVATGGRGHEQVNCNLSHHGNGAASFCPPSPTFSPSPPPPSTPLPSTLYLHPTNLLPFLSFSTFFTPFLSTFDNFPNYRPL